MRRDSREGEHILSSPSRRACLISKMNDLQIEAPRSVRACGTRSRGGVGPKLPSLRMRTRDPRPEGDGLRMVKAAIRNRARVVRARREFEHGRIRSCQFLVAQALKERKPYLAHLEDRRERSIRLGCSNG